MLDPDVKGVQDQAPAHQTLVSVSHKAQKFQRVMITVHNNFTVVGVWGAGGAGGVAGGELQLLKNWLNWFALSRLPDVCLSSPFIPVMFFIPVHTSLILFCWRLASSFLL